MPSLDPVTLTLSGVFVAGLATSLHCAGMCGLLTCGLGITGRGPALASVGIYHFARLAGYGVGGTIVGALGGSLGFNFNPAGVPWLPMLLILFLLSIVVGLDRRLGTLPGVGKVMTKIRLKTFQLPQMTRAAIVGFATPLLPCGPLYAIFALALASGSAIRGAEIMLSFGLGAIPGIFAVQVGSSWMNKKLGAQGFLYAKRGLAAAAALSLMWHFSIINGIHDGDHGSATCRCELETK